jgi:hypothetical protein
VARSGSSYGSIVQNRGRNGRSDARVPPLSLGRHLIAASRQRPPTIEITRLRKWRVSASVLSRPDALPRPRLCSAPRRGTWRSRVSSEEGASPVCGDGCCLPKQQRCFCRRRIAAAPPIRPKAAVPKQQCDQLKRDCRVCREAAGSSPRKEPPTCRRRGRASCPQCLRAAAEDRATALSASSTLSRALMATAAVAPLPAAAGTSARGSEQLPAA